MRANYGKEVDTMKNALTAIASRIPALIEHTTLSVNLSGWPATTAIGLVCGTVITLAAMALSHSASQGSAPA